MSLQLLTNRVAMEQVTLKDEGGATIAAVDIDRLTPRNERVFIGFISRVPFKSVLLDTEDREDGAAQNEGFDAIKVAESLSLASEAPERD